MTMPTDIGVVDTFDVDRSGGGSGGRAVESYPERFFGSLAVDPNHGVPALRKLQRAVEELGVKAASVNPCFVMFKLDE